MEFLGEAMEWRDSDFWPFLTRCLLQELGNQLVHLKWPCCAITLFLLLAKPEKYQFSILSGVVIDSKFWEKSCNGSIFFSISSGASGSHDLSPFFLGQMLKKMKTWTQHRRFLRVNPNFLVDKMLKTPFFPVKNILHVCHTEVLPAPLVRSGAQGARNHGAGPIFCWHFFLEIF